MWDTTTIKQAKEAKMKTTNILLSLAVMGTLTLGFADATNTDAEITQKVQAIKNAPAQERSAMMNELKADMQTMTPEQRKATVQEMQTTMHVDMGSMQTDMSMQHDKMQEHAQTMQTNNSDTMHREQNMNQQQAGHEYTDKAYKQGETFSQENKFFDAKH